MTPDAATEMRSKPLPLNAGSIVKLVAELDAAMRDLQTVCAQAEAEADDAEAIVESRLEQHQETGLTRYRPSPAATLDHLRNTYARQRAILVRTDARRFGAWWADVATCALIAAAEGVPLTDIRAGAANPFTHFDEAEMACLPGADKYTSELVGLIVRMSDADYRNATHRRDGADLAARAGLQILTGDDRIRTVVDDGTPEGRRRRIWGHTWTDFQIPDLPTPEQTTHMLGSLNLPTSITAEVIESRTAIDRVLRYFEGTTWEGDDEILDEAEDVGLTPDYTDVTERLTRYARAVTSAVTNINTTE